MRITETRMLGNVVSSMERSRNDLADAQMKVSSGKRVNLPSDDTASWAQAKRAEARLITSEHRGTAVNRAIESLAQRESSFQVVSESLTRAREIALMGANAAASPAERTILATELRTITGHIMAAMNGRDLDGEFLFAGTGTTPTNAAPFDSAGVPPGNYIGNSEQRKIEIADGQLQNATIPGSRFTAASGLDVFQSLEDFAVALETNNLAGIQTAVGDMDEAVKQTSSVWSELGNLSRALQGADETRKDIEIVLKKIKADAIEVDSINAAGMLAQASNALETAQAISRRILELTRV